ncbi:MAG: uroporphyrinogen-III synthase [Pseudomonadota bacterium]
MSVWVTRSEPGASRQGRALRDAGYEVLVAPVLKIEATAAREPVAGFNVVLFLSEQAVRFGGSLAYCQGARVYAVGRRTAAALVERGVTATVPAEASSEGLLLELEAVTLAGVRVLIVAGEGGRDLLESSLLTAGARVDLYHCYRRKPVSTRPENLDAVSEILIASQDGFRTVARLWFSGDGATDVKVIAASDRIARLGAELGFSNVHTAAGAAEADWLSALAATRND